MVEAVALKGLLGASKTALSSPPLASYLAHKKEFDRVIGRVLSGGNYILGQEVQALEREFARYIGVRFGVGVGSGTDALHLAMRALGIGSGDEVIVAAHTASATVAAAHMCGAKPVLVDIEPEGFNIDPARIAAAIGSRTKAVIAVHLYGHPAQMDLIKSIARSHKIYVIEDCAQSHGAGYRGRKTGAWGDLACFSFYPTKNLGCFGDGGMVLVDNPRLAQRVRLLREYGWRKRYISEISGFNSRLDEVQAAILRVRLCYLDEENLRRRELARIYGQSLKNADGLVCPIEREGARHAYHQYVIRVKKRDNLKQYLNIRGIPTLVHYPLPIHLQPAYKGRIKVRGSLRCSEQACGELLSLPIHPQLGFSQVRRISKLILKWLSR